MIVARARAKLCRQQRLWICSLDNGLAGSEEFARLTVSGEGRIDRRLRTHLDRFGADQCADGLNLDAASADASSPHEPGGGLLYEISVTRLVAS